jgi:hypothetical protein
MDLDAVQHQHTNRSGSATGLDHDARFVVAWDVELGTAQRALIPSID